MQVTTIQFILGGAVLGLSAVVHATPIGDSSTIGQRTIVEEKPAAEAIELSSLGPEEGTLGINMQPHIFANPSNKTTTYKGPASDPPPKDGLPILNQRDTSDDTSNIAARQGFLDLLDLGDIGEDAGGAEEGAENAANAAKSSNKSPAKGEKKEAQTTVAGQAPAATSAAPVEVMGIGDGI